MRRLVRLSAAAACAAALALAGCGSSDGEGGATAPAQPPPSAKALDFPVAKGKSLGELQAGLPEGPIFAPSVSLLQPGRNRIGFALFDVARKQLSGAAVALYVARADGQVGGPYIARSESLAVKPQFESRTTAQDPDAAKSVYVADVPLAVEGKIVVVAVARMDGRLLSTGPYSMEVGSKGTTPPAVGERAPKVSTPTLASVGGDASKISTRVPPAEDLLRTDLADVLGKKPVVLVFATPQLCVSRVCGPVVDVAEQVKAAVGDKVAFIHQEIYNDNEVAKGFRPQVRAYRLPTEPWTFIIDRTGKVSARFEGAESVGELQRAVEKVTKPAR
ncbi:MAG: hypothetical protein JWP18_1291 [Solirubrobacterales bacterium]|nr:hypothetical protein [Solirubrobacterales bacterium]